MKQYISEVIDAMARFSDVTHVHIIPSQGSIEASALGKEKTIMVKVVAPAQPLPAPMCLGNLKYLQRIMSVDLIKSSGAMKFTTGSAMDGTDIVRAIEFSGGNIKIRYETTDPRAHDLKAPTVKDQAWACSIDLQPSHSKQFGELLSLLKIVDPSKSDFRIETSRPVAAFVFDGIGSEMEVSQVTGNLPETANPGAYFLNSGRFSSALSLAADADSAKLSLSPSAAKLEFQLGDKEFLVVIPRLISATR